MRRLLLLSACCFSLAVSAAIITERNDEGVLPPPQYTFVGTSAAPGIESCWIPYGTYTDGVGGTEYTRVTSNLMGVVASALGGAAERARAVGYTSGVYDLTKYLLRPMEIPPEMTWYWSDHGEYLASATNTSLRIADQFNSGLFYYYYAKYEEYLYHYRVRPETIETLLAKTGDPYYEEYEYNAGIAGRFGSRRLEQLVGVEDPPVSTTWTNKIPYDINDVDIWGRVCPTYGACTNDIHFFPGTNTVAQHTIPYIDSRCGNDVYDAYWALHYALTNRHFSVTLEDVLSVDTGWKYEYPPRLTNDYWTIDGMRLNRASIDVEWDDLANAYIADWDFYTNGLYYVIEARYFASEWSYFCFDTSTSETIFQYLVSGTPTSTSLDFEGLIAGKTELWTHADDYTHWRNMTTRLDWTRLGIICQLERQMEISYHTDLEDTLPYRVFNADHAMLYDDHLTIDLPSPAETQTTNFAMDALGPAWSKYDERYSITTNDIGWTRPTCRIPSTAAFGTVSVLGGDLLKDIQLGLTNAVDMLTLFAQQAGLTNGEHDVVIYGKWNSQLSELWYNAFLAEGCAWVTHPSNTVSVTVDGHTTSMTGPDPIDSRRWNFHGDQEFWQLDIEMHDFYYERGDTSWAATTVSCNLPEVLNPTNDTYTAPSIIFAAVGDGDPTNWMWQATGIQGTNCVRTITADHVSWRWEDNSYIDYYLADGWWDCYTQNQNGLDFEQFDTNALPRVISSPAITVTWQTDSYRQWEVVWTNDTPGILDWQMPVAYDVTNTTVRAILDVEKRASGAWTCSGDEDKSAIMNSFAEDWEQTHSERRLAVECLLSDSGPAAHANASDFSNTGSSSFTWDGIESHSGSGRLFRKYPENPVEATSLAAAKSARWDIVHALDEACKDYCVTNGKVNPRDLANFGKVTPSDVAEIQNALLGTSITAQYGFNTPTNDFIVAAHISISDDGGEPSITVSDCSAGYDSPGTIPTYVGWNGWTLHATNVSATATQDVRADGYSSAILRTLWKFKNLRDPEL